LGPRFGKDANRAADLLRSLPEAQVQALDRGESIEVEGLTFRAEDATIERAAPDHYAVSAAEELTVALNLTLTPQLTDEGRARDLVHQIQNLRRETGFEVTDRIRIEYATDAEMERAIAQHLDWIKAETLALEVISSNQSPIQGAVPIRIDRFDVYLKLTKVEAM
jgi:isoleucyl-tRNA synthetase